MGAVGSGALVVHGKTATEVQVAHGRALFHQPGVVPARFEHTVAHVADIGHLGAEVAMQHLQAVQHVGGAQLIHHCNECRSREAEN